MSGPKIDRSKTSLEEINELLEDSTKAHDAGRDFGVYVEDILNDLCEQLHAEMRYRYIKLDPPTTEELFIALYKRLKDKLSKNPVVVLVQNAQKYEPLIRNATSHSRQNYSSTITPDEVRRAIEEWLKLEKALWCSSCNKFVEYKRDRDQIECRCGKLKLEKIT
jgi:16S rRNA G966 N2-methylase RsmD